MLRRTPDDPIVSDWLNLIDSVHSLGPVKMHQNLFFFARKCALRGMGGWQHQFAGIYARLHAFLFCQPFLMSHKWEPACFYAVMMQERKDMREKIIEPKIYLDVKLKTKWWCMGNHELQSVFRQHATNSTRFFLAESSFNEHISEKVSLIGFAFIARHQKQMRWERQRVFISFIPW